MRVSLYDHEEHILKGVIEMPERPHKGDSFFPPGEKDHPGWVVLGVKWELADVDFLGPSKADYIVTGCSATVRLANPSDD